MRRRDQKLYKVSPLRVLRDTKQLVEDGTIPLGSTPAQAAMIYMAWRSGMSGDPIKVGSPDWEKIFAFIVMLMELLAKYFDFEPE